MWIVLILFNLNNSVKGDNEEEIFAVLGSNTIWKFLIRYCDVIIFGETLVMRLFTYLYCNKNE